MFASFLLLLLLLLFIVNNSEASKACKMTSIELKLTFPDEVMRDCIRLSSSANRIGVSEVA